MYVWIARDKGSEWKVIQALAGGGSMPCRVVVECVPDELLPKRTGRSLTPDQLLQRLLDRLSPVATSETIAIDFDNLLHVLSAADVSRLVHIFFARAQSLRLRVVPVVRTSSPPELADALVVWGRAYGLGLVIRVHGTTGLEQSAARASELESASGLGASQLDLIVDAQDVPSHVSYSRLSDMLTLSETARSWAVVAGVFPDGITHLSPDEYEHRIDRVEWEVYGEQLATLKGRRRPDFGDYATQCAIYRPSVSFPPSPTVRYTVDGQIVVLRGRKTTPQTFEQFIGHSRYLVAQPYFGDVIMTSGDHYVQRIARGDQGTGNSTTWRVASLHRHLVVARQQVEQLIVTMADQRA